MLELMNHGLSLKGRATRLEFLVVNVVIYLISSLPGILVTLYLGPSTVWALKTAGPEQMAAMTDPKFLTMVSIVASFLISPFGKPLLYLGMAIYVLLTAIWVAVQVRRFHDLNRSGWWAITIWVAMFLLGLVMGVVIGVTERFYPNLTPEILNSLKPFFAVIQICALIFTVGYHAVLLLWPGSRGTNPYGPDERETKLYIRMRQAEVKAQRLDRKINGH